MSGIKQLNLLRITSYARVHLSLIAMNEGGYRKNGGLGFSILDPQITLLCEISTKFEIDDKREVNLTIDEKGRFLDVIERAGKRINSNLKIRYTISGDSLPHTGFGSNTSIYLSAIEALFILSNVSYSNDDIISLSTRGGTSGIGINTYFYGGFIFDIGKINSNEGFLPSSKSNNALLPLIIKRSKLPEWSIGICIPAIKNMTEDEELKFFIENCPIANKDIYSTLYEAVYGITASILEDDYSTFCKAVNKIQLCRWKSLERQQYGSDLIEIEKYIIKIGADCVGMSSLGPALFYCGRNIEEINYYLKLRFPTIKTIKTTFNNHGRVIQYD